MKETNQPTSASAVNKHVNTNNSTSISIALDMGPDIPEKSLVTITAVYHWALSKDARTEIEKLMGDLYDWITSTVF